MSQNEVSRKVDVMAQEIVALQGMLNGVLKQVSELKDQVIVSAEAGQPHKYEYAEAYYRPDRKKWIARFRGIKLRGGQNSATHLLETDSEDLAVNAAGLANGMQLLIESVLGKYDLSFDAIVKSFVLQILRV